MMNRIIWHHSGGPYAPTADDLEAYHRTIDGDGKLHLGRHPISANAPGRKLLPGRYAAHCLDLNGGSIGPAINALGGKNTTWADPFGSTAFPVKPVQVDALIADSARLCIEYGIVPDRRFTLSHAEVEITLGIKQRNKWDFDYPPRGGPGRRDPVAIGDDLRAELVRAIARHGGRMPEPPASSRPNLSQGSKGAVVSELQTLLRGLTVDGHFGPATRAAVVRFQHINELLPDGIVGRMTWAALAPKSGV